jgi:methylenetetrahydrofolate reductase (NADPH)
MPLEQIDAALEKCKEIGITNILALRGDPPAGHERWTAVEGGFHNAIDLVRHIKNKHGDYFCIAVAAYPETHLECEDPELDVQRLKEKLDAGADFAITQMFFDVQIYVDFVNKCRRAGIVQPIIPGILPIMTYTGFKRMTEFCQTKVP